MFRSGLARVCSLFATTQPFGALMKPVVSSIVPYKNMNKATPNVLYSTFNNCSLIKQNILAEQGNGFLVPKSPFPLTQIDKRSLTKFSLKSGKRKTVKAVLKRFYRLNWGIWIRTKCGRQKKLYKKSANRKRRLRQHVFTNTTQSYLLDKMVCRYWRKPKYYPEDVYNPYHKREEFPFTRKSPVPSRS